MDIHSVKRVLKKISENNITCSLCSQKLPDNSLEINQNPLIKIIFDKVTEKVKSSYKALLLFLCIVRQILPKVKQIID